jgi:hypothetical protein
MIKETFHKDKRNWESKNQQTLHLTVIYKPVVQNNRLMGHNIQHSFEEATNFGTWQSWKLPYSKCFDSKYVVVASSDIEIYSYSPRWQLKTWKQQTGHIKNWDRLAEVCT